MPVKRKTHRAAQKFIDSRACGSQQSCVALRRTSAGASPSSTVSRFRRGGNFDHMLEKLSMTTSTIPTMENVRIFDIIVPQYLRRGRYGIGHRTAEPVLVKGLPQPLIIE